MDAITRQTLIEKMHEVIKEEGLPVPYRILIRQPSRGFQSALGRAICMRKNNNYHIVITVTSPVYVKDDNGRFHARNNINEHYRCDGWKEQTKTRIINTVAHELAHLKYWAHDIKHKGYTLHLEEVLCNKLKDWNNS